MTRAVTCPPQPRLPGLMTPLLPPRLEPMRAPLPVLLALLLPLLALPGAGARAESLRCAGGIAAEGDSRLSVLHKCGPPHLADAFCAPVFAGSFLNPVPAPWAAIVAPCQPTEDWLYERGPGNLVATVRIRGGSVLSITYGSALR